MQIKIDTASIVKKLEKFKDAEKDIIEAVDNNAKDIVLDAKNNAPVNKKVGLGGDLQQSIYQQQTDNKGLTQKIAVGGVAKEYAPYMEFGTGAKVDLKHLQELGIPDSYAAQFKGKGIKEVNLRPQPFLFPAALRGWNNLKTDLQDILKRFTK